MKNQNIIKNLVVLVVLMMVSSVNALCDHKIYVEVSSGTSIGENWDKNHVLIRNLDDDGYIMMVAIHKTNGTGDHWAVRLTETTDAGVEVWSFDYELLEAGTEELSATPFAIIHNLDNDGYVIAGAWENWGSSSLTHANQLSPFYLEVDGSGGVVEIKRHKVEGGNKGYVPLSICKGVDEYLTVGVKSTDYECISCARKIARLSKLDASLEETAARDLFNNYTITTTTPFVESYFDALCKIKKVPGQNEYIISGSLTENIVANTATSCGIYQKAGCSVAYIAKINSSLQIQWDKQFTDYGNQTPAAEPIHTTCPDFTFDSGEGETSVHGVINIIIEQNRTRFPGYYFELDYTNGSQSVFKLIGNTDSLRSSFFTNIFEEEDSLYLCGFAHKTVNGNPQYGQLMPTVFILDKSALTEAGTFYINADNNNFFNPGGFDDCYLGVHYLNTNDTYDDLVLSDGSCSGLVTPNNQTKSPIIYAPSSWVYVDHDGLNLACHVTYKGQNANITYSTSPTFFTSPEFHPSLYYDITSDECNYFEDDLVFQQNEDFEGSDAGDFLIDTTTEVERTVDDHDPDILVGVESCQIGGEAFFNGGSIFDEGMERQKNGLESVFGESEDAKGHEAYAIYDMRGVLIAKSESFEYLEAELRRAGIAEGVYIFSKSIDGKVVRVQKFMLK